MSARGLRRTSARVAWRFHRRCTSRERPPSAPSGHYTCLSRRGRVRVAQANRQPDTQTGAPLRRGLNGWFTSSSTASLAPGTASARDPPSRAGGQRACPVQRSAATRATASHIGCPYAFRTHGGYTNTVATARRRDTSARTNAGPDSGRGERRARRQCRDSPRRRVSGRGCRSARSCALARTRVRRRAPTVEPEGACRSPHWAGEQTPGAVALVTERAPAAPPSALLRWTNLSSGERPAYTRPVHRQGRDRRRSRRPRITPSLLRDPSARATATTDRSLPVSRILSCVGSRDRRAGECGAWPTSYRSSSGAIAARWATIRKARPAAAEFRHCQGFRGPGALTSGRCGLFSGWRRADPRVPGRLCLV